MTVRDESDKLKEIAKLRLNDTDKKSFLALAKAMNITPSQLLRQLSLEAIEHEEVIINNVQRFGIEPEMRKLKRTTGAVRTIGQIINDMDIGSSQTAANA